MKRWIWRILMGCSIGLMLAAVGLTIRGIFAHDVGVIHMFAMTNLRYGAIYQADAAWLTFAHPGYMSLETDPQFSWTLMVPRLAREGGAIWMPHWILFTVGTAYPTFAWLRRRRRKKNVGFPVEEVGPRTCGEQSRTMNTNVHE